MACDPAVNIQEYASAVGTDPQADIATASAAYLRIPQINPDIAVVEYITEDDAKDIGKGDEFPTTQFKVSKNITAKKTWYLNSHIAKWALGFAVGTPATTTAGGGSRDTITLIDPVADGICLPTFTILEKFREDAGSPPLDRALIGCVINSLQIDINSGPGRQNAQISVDIIGSRETVPSAIALPAVTAQKALNAATLTFTANSVNYVTLKTFVSLSFKWDNGLRDTGYYPGSGSEDGFQTRGRMEFGERSASLTFVGRFAEGSLELTKLKAVTEGTAAFGIVGATGNDFNISSPRCAFSSAILGNTNGIVTVQVDVKFLKHSSSGYIAAYATTN
jgi:hypothetical protein